MENAARVQFWCVFVKINWSNTIDGKKQERSGKEADKLFIVTEFIVTTKTYQARRNKTLCHFMIVN